jgi:nicotinamidase-related amidase
VDYLAPDFSRAALITIDTQVDTLDGEALEIPGTSAAVPNITVLAGAFREAGLEIVHIVRLYLRDGSNVDPCRRGLVESGIEILAPGSRGTQLAPGLVEDTSFELDPQELLAGRSQEVRDREVVIYKPRWGAFYETPLDAYLRERDITTLVFCGANFPNCPRTSIYEASERDYRIVLAEDAISGLYERGCRELLGIGVQLMPVAAIVESLSRAATRSV